MKLKFKAKGLAPAAYDVNGAVINGIDLALFPVGAVFTGNDETLAAGIFDVFWQDSVLHVVLGQMTKMIEFPIAGREGEWIDAADYDPAQRYIVSTDPNALALLGSGQAEWFQDSDGKWSVRMIESVEQEATV